MTSQDHANVQGTDGRVSHQRPSDPPTANEGTNAPENDVELAGTPQLPSAAAEKWRRDVELTTSDDVLDAAVDSGKTSARHTA